MISKLALGSVQFGMDYGISNEVGEVCVDEVKKIISLARTKGINVIDTAKAYGFAEEKLGAAGLEGFDVIDKITVSNNVVGDVRDSLDKLEIAKLHALLIHDFEGFESDQQYYEQFQQCKALGLTDKIGFSLNFQHELKFLIKNNVQFDFVQLPYNLLDQRFSDQFELLQSMDIEIHVRSVFLQGLFFLDPSSLSSYLDNIKLELSRLNEICYRENISKSSLALGFVILNPCISKVVVGVTSEKELAENLDGLKDIEKVRELIPVLNEVRCDNEQLVVPGNWEI